MTLATSGSGSTAYMEPTPLVPLNNAEALLSAREQEIEDEILLRLSQEVRGFHEGICLGCVVMADVEVELRVRKP